MKIAMAQVNPVIGDFRKNGEKLVEYTRKAKDLGCDLVVFPELSISGYPPGDLLEKEDFVTAQMETFDTLVKTISGIGVICGMVRRNPSSKGPKLFNSAALFENGNILAFRDKQLLPTYDIFDETRYFKPGTGTSPFRYKGLNLGITICEDIWNDDDTTLDRIHYDLNPIADLAAQGVDLFINVSASPFHAGKGHVRDTMLTSIARKYRTPLIFTNQVGGNDTILFDGLSCAMDSTGDFLARAWDFREDLVVVDTASKSSKDIHPVSLSITESIFKALVTGTRDYVRKCGFTRAVLGSSGGIDSAVTAAIAAEALGPGNVLTLFMPSMYTSRKNFDDTRDLAANLGIGFQVVPIDDLYSEFLKLSGEFDPARPGITEQNLQARIRGTILMAFSNKEGRILLSTGNKSEMAVGYATLYGDMCGGLAVIGDLPKKKVYDMAAYVNQSGIKIPESIISKAPSAELAPDQKDQDDLPPYDTIDAVVEGYVEKHMSVDQLVASGLPREAVKHLVGRINRSEYKRYQAPPILRVTSKAFGPGRRYPMAQNFTL
ncbi:MAG: NAD+ synthase [Pseudomonadota bacterium]